MRCRSCTAAQLRISKAALCGTLKSTAHTALERWRLRGNRGAYIAAPIKGLKMTTRVVFMQALKDRCETALNDTERRQAQDAYANIRKMSKTAAIHFSRTK